jgi:hypothetical protein
LVRRSSASRLLRLLAVFRRQIVYRFSEKVGLRSGGLGRDIAEPTPAVERDERGYLFFPFAFWSRHASSMS